MKQHKFTIIIPTRERAETLYWSLKTCLAQDYENLQVIVSDNFSQDNTKEVVHSFEDKRIKYINTGRRVDMSSNWEFALSHVEDGFVCFLGDDDGIMPQAIPKIADILSVFPYPAISWNVAGYIWPNVATADCNTLNIPFPKGVFIRNGNADLRRFYKLTSRLSNAFGLFKIYQRGFVAYKLLAELKQQFNGRFFRSPTPDVFSSIVLSKYIGNYVYVDIPFGVSGTAAKSNSGAYTLGLTFGEVGGEAHEYMQELGEILPHPKVAIATAFPSTMIAEAIFRAEEEPPDFAIPEKQEKFLGRFVTTLLWKDVSEVVVPSLYEEGVGLVRQMARLHNLEDYVESLIKSGKPPSPIVSQKTTTKGYKTESLFVVKGNDFNITNVYEAARFCSNLFNYNEHVEYYRYQTLALGMKFIGRKISRAASKLLGNSV